MRRFALAMGVVVSLAMLAALPASAAVKGDYMEVRSADVYTGPCFANGQVGLEGKQAIMAWHVREGSWQGTDLAGLNVVAVVNASATLGDPYHTPYPARAVLILDQRATSAQKAALAGFAKSAGGKLLSQVVLVKTAPISLEIGAGHVGMAKMVAGHLATIETRSLCSGDIICGNEYTYYPPLLAHVHAMPAFALRDSYQGNGLGTVWTNLNHRSAFVGNFNIG
jgi:hypothetical protein